MEDRFLRDIRRDPPPELARRLRIALAERDGTGAVLGFGPRATKWFASAASLALVALAFSLPSVRAGAEAFLDLFRVGGFVGVAVDVDRLRSMDLSELDLPAMLGDQIEVLTPPSDPVALETPAAAASAVGFDVLEPAWLPAGWQREGIVVTGESAFSVTASTAGLSYLLAALAIDDLTVPDGLDGETVTVRVPPVVQTTYAVHYGDSTREAALVQARSPEVTFPAGFDVPVLAEIALRILGLDRDEAYRLAWTVDWRSTLIVPVPAVGASFRDVNVAGSDGLLIEPTSGERMLLWATADRVFALSGRIDTLELLEMAQTTQ